MKTKPQYATVEIRLKKEHAAFLDKIADATGVPRDGVAGVLFMASYLSSAIPRKPRVNAGTRHKR